MMKSIKPYEKYKESGIAWLGEIPESWKATKGKYIFTNKKELNSDLKENNRLSLTLNGVKNKNISDNKGLNPNDFATYQKFNENDLVFKLIDLENIKTSRVGLVHESGIMSSAYIRLITHKCSHPKYFYYLFYNWYKQNIFNYLGSGVRSTMTSGNLLDLRVPIFYKQEQEKIANFLDYKTAKIDRFIAKKKQLIKLLNEQKAGIINDAVTKGLNTNAKTKPSGIEWLGNIPAHWEVKKLKGICKAFGRIGFRGYKTTDLVSRGEGAVTISPSNMKYDFMTFEKCTYLSWDKYEESPEIKIFNDDIIMVKTGSTYGKVGIVKNLDEKATINPQLLVLKEVGINPNYLYLLLKSNLVQTQVKTEVIGSTIPTISQTKILNFRLVMPPRSEIECILSSLEKETATINKTIATIEKEIALVAEYRTALIAEAVTGKIDVRDYEIGSIETEEVLEELEITPDDVEELEGLEEQDEN